MGNTYTMAMRPDIRHRGSRVLGLCLTIAGLASRTRVEAQRNLNSAPCRRSRLTQG